MRWAFIIYFRVGPHPHALMPSRALRAFALAPAGIAAGAVSFRG
jgi:hypothetical protein